MYLKDFCRFYIAIHGHKVMLVQSKTRKDGPDMTTYLTLAHLRRKLAGRSRSAVYLDIEAGRLPPPIKLGGRLLWPESEIDAALAALRETA